MQIFLCVRTLTNETSRNISIWYLTNDWVPSGKGRSYDIYLHLATFFAKLATLRLILLFSKISSVLVKNFPRYFRGPSLEWLRKKYLIPGICYLDYSYFDT